MFIIFIALVSKTFQPFIKGLNADREGIRGNCAAVQPVIQVNVQYNKLMAVSKENLH